MNLRKRILRRGAFVGLAVAAASVAGTAQPTTTPASVHPAVLTAAVPLGCIYIGPNPAIGFAGLVCTAGGHGFVVVFTSPLPTFGAF